MKKTIFLLTMACALNASGWAATPAVQVKEGRQTIQLSGQGWRLLLDKAAPWKNDHLFPPSEISNVSLLPINMPSGGWQMLNTSQQLVKVPGTVEEFTTSSDTPRVEDYVGVSWWYRDIEVPSDLTHIAARSSPLVKDSQQKVDIEPEKTQNPPFFG